MTFILALDLGTTGIRACVFNDRGQAVGRGYSANPSQYPQPGWVEQDAHQMWRLAQAGMTRALEEAKITWREVAAIGITNQRETIVLWDQETGEPLHNAIVWQCRRTRIQCEQLIQTGHQPLVREKTGLMINPYFSASKIQWLLENVPEAQPLLGQNRLRVGTVDTWALWNLTGGKVHATDATNASRTLLFNIHTLDWDSDLLALFHVPRDILPAVHPSAHWFGVTDPALTGGCEIPITGIAGDQQASLYGHVCFETGASKCTYGTGAFWLMNLDQSPTGHAETAPLLEGILTTTIAKAEGAPAYGLEGAMFTAGAVLEWLSGKLGFAPSAAELAPLAASAPDSGGVTLIPAFAGMGSPYWYEGGAGATLQGLTLGTTSAHLARAAYEAIAFRTRDMLEAVHRANPALPLEALRVDGGLTRADFFVQLLADVLGVPVLRSQDAELTARGAAYLAGLQAGVWASPETLQALPQSHQRFEPGWSRERREAAYGEWQGTVQGFLE